MGNLKKIRAIDTDYARNGFRRKCNEWDLLMPKFLYYVYDEDTDSIIMQHNPSMDVLSKVEALELIDLLNNYVNNQEYYQNMLEEQRKEKEMKTMEHEINTRPTYAKKKTKSYVYLMQDGNMTKIGISIDPMERLHQLRAGNPKLELLYAKLVRSAAKTEKELHEKYDNKRIGREWFDLSPKDISEIKKYLNFLSKDGDK